jgi:hypothetical protein
VIDKNNKTVFKKYTRNTRLFLMLITLSSFTYGCASSDTLYEEDIASYSCNVIKTEIAFQEKLKEDIIERSEYMHPAKSIMAVAMTFGTEMLVSDSSPIEGQRHSKRLQEIDEKTALLKERKNGTCT